MIAKLVDRLQSGDLEAIDRALKIVDRLDRYHGFTKAKRLPNSMARRSARNSSRRSTRSRSASSRKSRPNDGRGG